MSTGAEIAAIEAAKQEELLRQKEEEELTKYSDAELQGEWEFKIVRSNLASFKKPEVLQQVCDEEAQAGWVLLEKFDDRRLRFKRPISARARDAQLGFDPYRTQYGTSSSAIAMIAIAIVLAISGGILALVILK